MGAPVIFRIVSLAGIAMFALAVGIQDAAAQWTYRIATDPYIRNISTFINTPSAGTNSLIVSTLTDGMYKVVDTGSSATSTFQKISNGLPIVEIRTHTTIDINTMYAGTDGAGLFKSTNGGAFWTPLNGSGGTPLGCAHIRSINFDATMPLRTLIVGTACRNNSGFYKSIDDGANWTRLGNATLPDDVAVSALTRDVPSNTYFLASSNYGIFKSIDAGATWAAANSGITVPSGAMNAFNVQFNGPAPANLLTYVHGSGMYRSIDAGANWTSSNTGLPAGFAALGGIAREGTTATLYIGLDKQGVYRKLDGGASWAPWGSTATHNRAKFTRTVAIATAGTTYYFGTLDGIAKTTDNASTINGVQLGNSGGRLNAITHDRDTPYRAYVTGPTLFELDYIYGDCSAGCNQLDTGLTGSTIDGAAYQDQTTPTVLYVTTINYGVFKSTNAGVLFGPINNGLPNMIGQSSRLAIDANNPQILYLGLSVAAGVYKSTDGGTSWNASFTVVPAPNAQDAPKVRSINTVTLDPNNSAIVYAATDAGLYKSINSGATWALTYSATDSGGSLLPVSAMRVRIGNSSELYIANNHANADGTLAASSGVHKSIDGGANWNNILPSKAASQVRVLANGHIYAGISDTVNNPAVLRSTDNGTSFSPYSVGLNGSDIRTFGVAADFSAVLSLSLENGLYTHDAAGPPPSVAVTAAITEAPGIFTNVFFGYQTVNTTSASKAVTITNTSATPASIVAFGFFNQDNFAVQSHNCPIAPLAFAVGASCTVNVTYTPIFTGLATDVLVAAGPVSGIAVNLRGYGINNGQPALLVANDPGMGPAYPGFYNQSNLREITFGTQAIGTSRTITVTLLNVGTATANISSYTGVSTPMSVGGTCGATIPAGGSCQLSVTYAPIGAGVTNQTLNINHNSPFPIQAPYPFLLYGIAENPATDGSLIPAFGATTNPGGAGKAFVSFGPYGQESVDRIAIQTDGKILTLMTARKAVEDGIAVAGIARLNADGTLDTSWGTGGYVRLTPASPANFFAGNSGLYARPDGTVIVAFASGNASTSTTLEVYRLLSNGQIDATFGTGGSTAIANLAFNRLDIYPDGRMLANGSADTVNNNKLGLVRLNANGSFDASFGTGGRVEMLVPDVLQLGGTQGTIRTRFAADEKIFVAYSYNAGGARDIVLYKLTTAGVIDTTWGTAGRIYIAATNREDNVRNMRVQSDGKILLLSRTARIAGGGAYESVMTRLNADGSIDTAFGTAGVVTTTILPGTNLPSPMQVTADGKILVAGSRNCAGTCLSGRDAYVARYLPDGSLDAGFGVGGIEEIVISTNFDAFFDFAIDIDGSIVAGGQSSQFDVDRGNTIDNGLVVRLKNTVGAALVNLTVSVSGIGAVTSSPGAINCGNVCIASFAPSTMVTLTAVTSGGSTFAGWSGGGCGVANPCTVTMTAATNVTASFTGGTTPATLLGVQSRKVHAGVPYDLPVTMGLPMTVEPRAIGAGHKIVFQFDQPVNAIGTVTTTSGAATALVTGSNDVIVTLTGVADNQRATITLSTINGNGTANASILMGFLVGDVSGSQTVNASDISAVKARASATLTQQNFKFDLNVSGAINAQDTSLVKSRSGLVMP